MFRDDVAINLVNAPMTVADLVGAFDEHARRLSIVASKPTLRTPNEYLDLGYQVRAMNLIAGVEGVDVIKACRRGERLPAQRITFNDGSQLTTSADCELLNESFSFAPVIVGAKLFAGISAEAVDKLGSLTFYTFVVPVLGNIKVGNIYVKVPRR